MGFFDFFLKRTLFFSSNREPTREDEAEVEAALGATAASISAAGASDKCVASLAYLRDRIGVPRDVSFPAARQLRTRINWAISGLEK